MPGDYGADRARQLRATGGRAPGFGFAEVSDETATVREYLENEIYHAAGDYAYLAACKVVPEKLLRDLHAIEDHDALKGDADA